MFIGIYFSQFIEGHKLKKGFGWFVLVMITNGKDKVFKLKKEAENQIVLNVKKILTSSIRFISGCSNCW